MNRRLAHRVAASLLAALLASCATVQDPAQGPASADRATRLLRQGNPAAAAQMYERLSVQNPPPEGVDFSLAAARAWLAANRADDAQRALGTMAANVGAAQQFERELLQAEVALARGQYAPAWQQLSAVAEPRGAVDAGRLFQLQQQVALRAGLPLDAVRAGLGRERVAPNDAERLRVRRELLTELRAAIDRGMRVDPASSRDAMIRGWLEIAQIAASAGRSPLGAEAAVASWRNRFPGHPAATIAAAEIVNPAERPGTSSLRVVDSSPIGLLLPLTGRVAVQAALIRDGFLAGIARLPEGSRPAVRVYDTGAMPVGTAIQTAQAEGAGFIVGPLTPEEVQAAVEQRPANLPLLLLNNLRAGGYAGAQLFQFALAPEDEARQIARQMFASGQQRAVVLAPSGDWGSRVALAFSEELTRAGGQVLTEGYYDLARNDLTAAVTRALGIDDARARQRRMQQIIGLELHFDPHPRPDIDAIFVPGGYQPLALRQINPQLRFFNAGGIPTYITQDGLAGDVTANRDLEGMRLVQMPWMLDTTGAAADTRAATESVWGARGVAQSRYFAFGYDAATLAASLRSAQPVWPLGGLTGNISLTPEGRVERSQLWARMREGSAQLADPSAP
jgi:uncharacterized protein